MWNCTREKAIKHEIVRERQLKFTGHYLHRSQQTCTCCTNNNVEPRLVKPRHTFFKLISSYLSRNAGPSLRVEEYVRYDKNEPDWKLSTRPSDEMTMKGNSLFYIEISCYGLISFTFTPIRFSIYQKSEFG